LLRIGAYDRIGRSGVVEKSCLRQAMWPCREIVIFA
jgi:hypothetical protein